MIKIGRGAGQHVDSQPVFARQNFGNVGVALEGDNIGRENAGVGVEAVAAVAVEFVVANPVFVGVEGGVERRTAAKRFFLRAAAVDDATAWSCRRSEIVDGDTSAGICGADFERRLESSGFDDGNFCSGEFFSGQRRSISGGVEKRTGDGFCDCGFESLVGLVDFLGIGENFSHLVSCYVHFSEPRVFCFYDCFSWQV